uniref:Uncharacterized protein n=1 Tax=Tetraselmis sp. GSL018 TaxID=582737 RepID=A0A061QSX6_9CHLO|mmetsp:Transcript_10461/g.24762  ORF Transcript_10461/g.24762 Transcript_10461/m.24762 type:complete len:139 (-) Transcript_10461:272-688(-)
MTSLISSLWTSADSLANRRNKNPSSSNSKSFSADENIDTDRSKSVTRVFQPAVHQHTDSNVWQSVFNPGRNMSVKQNTASYYDNPGESRATTWDQVLRADQAKRGALAHPEKDFPEFAVERLHPELNVSKSGGDSGHS